MRPLESVLLLIVVVASLVQMTNFGRRWRVPLTLLAVLVCIWHLLREGKHWQMFPVYAGLALLIVWQVLRPLPPISRWQWGGRIFASLTLLLCVVGLGLSYLFPMFSLPKPTGPYPVGTRILDMVDGSRSEDEVADPKIKRELIVQVWYPAHPSNNELAPYNRAAETKFLSSYRSLLRTNSRMDAPLAMQGAPFPVLLFNHGWSGRRTLDTFLTEELASHGYVVASIDHTYNAMRVALPGGRVVDGVRGGDLNNLGASTVAQIETLWNKELDKWTADEVFVLNSLQAANLDPQSPWYGRLNTNMVGAIGHSFGGAASLQVCGLDNRVRSAINMDGWTFGGLRYRSSNKSIMFLSEAVDPAGLAKLHSSSNPDERMAAELDLTDMDAVSTYLKDYGGYRLFISGTQHMDFTDQPLTSPFSLLSFTGPIAPARIQNILRTYVLAFFDKTLRGQDPAVLNRDNSSPFHEVQMEQWTPKVQAAQSIP
jgi:predicted dienelactone hydrolase